MQTWQTEKPVFTEPCILLTASYWEKSKRWTYTLFTVERMETETDAGEYAWYWALLQDGSEWGDIDDLRADLYMTMPLLNSDQNPEMCDATESQSKN